MPADSRRAHIELHELHCFSHHEATGQVYVRETTHVTGRRERVVVAEVISTAFGREPWGGESEAFRAREDEAENIDDAFDWCETVTTLIGEAGDRFQRWLRGAETISKKPPAQSIDTRRRRSHEAG